MIYILVINHVIELQERFNAIRSNEKPRKRSRQRITFLRRIRSESCKLHNCSHAGSQPKPKNVPRILVDRVKAVVVWLHSYRNPLGDTGGIACIEWPRPALA